MSWRRIYINILFNMVKIFANMKSKGDFWREVKIIQIISLMIPNIIKKI